MRKTIFLTACISILFITIFASAQQRANEESPSVMTTQRPLIIRNVIYINGVPEIKKAGERYFLLIDNTGISLQKGDKRLHAFSLSQISRATLGSRIQDKSPNNNWRDTFKKKPANVDILLVDYINDEDKLVTFEVHIQKGSGAACIDWLSVHGIHVIRPESDSKQTTE
jgi:hypothetical protein